MIKNVPVVKLFKTTGTKLFPQSTKKHPQQTFPSAAITERVLYLLPCFDLQNTALPALRRDDLLGDKGFWVRGKNVAGDPEKPLGVA